MSTLGGTEKLVCLPQVAITHLATWLANQEGLRYEPPIVGLLIWGVYHRLRLQQQSIHLFGVGSTMSTPGGIRKLVCHSHFQMLLIISGYYPPCDSTDEGVEFKIRTFPRRSTNPRQLSHFLASTSASIHFSVHYTTSTSGGNRKLVCHLTFQMLLIASGYHPPCDPTEELEGSRYEHFFVGRLIWGSYH